MEKSKERLQVIENIKKAVENGNFNQKVELDDPVMSQEERENVIVNYDLQKKKIRNKLKYFVTRNVTDLLMYEINKDTQIVGIENIKDIDSGAIITSNHFSIVDTTIIRYMLTKIHKAKKMNILVQETNFLMKGIFGWLIKNNKTIPLSLDHKYLADNFCPAMKEIFDNKEFVLIYPEEEMWFNYRKPRPPKIGAYHYATKYNVPIIPCFTKIEDTEEVGEDGFKKSKYTLYIMPPIYPDENKELRENKYEMQAKDYECKKKMYEEAYNKKIDYTFEEDDIAGM